MIVISEMVVIVIVTVIVSVTVNVTEIVIVIVIMIVGTTVGEETSVITQETGTLTDSGSAPVLETELGRMRQGAETVTESAVTPKMLTEMESG